MIHNMKLHQNPFKKIQNKIKKIEFRLNDEKRQKIKIDDEILFTNIETNETIKVKVIRLSYFKTFLEAFESLVGYNDLTPNENAENMNKYYSKEKQQQNQILAIHIKLI